MTCAIELSARETPVLQLVIAIGLCNTQHVASDILRGDVSKRPVVLIFGQVSHELSPSYAAWQNLG